MIRHHTKNYPVEILTLVIFVLTGSGCASGEDLAEEQQTNQESISVTFSVDMSGPVEAGWFDPLTERVGIRGDVPPLSWSHNLPAIDSDGDLVYEITIEYEQQPSSPVVFKFKVDGEDNPNEGWQIGRNRSLDVSTGSFATSFGDEPPPLPTTFTGDVRVHEGFESADLDLEPRSIFVYLPPGYEESSERYPVVYMHDGRNVFDASEVGSEWRMDEHAESLIKSGDINPLIIVGMGNTPERIREYTPSAQGPNPAGQTTGGGGDLYGRLIVEVIKPFVDQTYRTRPDRESTAIGGSSLGGLISMYLGLKYDEVFGSLLVVSPSVWWDDRFIVREVELHKRKYPQRIWLDVGGREGEQMVNGARALHSALRGAGWTEGEIQFVEDEEADHSERAWAGRSEDMLRFLYGRNSDE